MPALNNFIFCLTNIFLLSKKDRQVKIELTTTFFGKCLYLLLRDIDPNTHTHTHTKPVHKHKLTSLTYFLISSSEFVGCLDSIRRNMFENFETNTLSQVTSELVRTLSRKLWKHVSVARAAGRSSSSFAF